MVSTRKIPTIQDVARHASVSTATVSRALSSPERVSARTRERVDEAVRVTGYTLNQAARSLRKRSTKTILVALPNISNPFFSPVLGAIERVISARGYNVLLVNCAPAQGNVQLQNYFLSNQADGLLLLDGSMRVELLKNLFAGQQELPIVIACEEIPGSGLHTVKTDNPEAAEAATAYLISLGHRRIAQVSSPKCNVLYAERNSGYSRAMAKAGIAVNPDYQVEGNFTLESGAAAARKLLALPNPPTAVFCANDETAIGFMSEARRLGFECPRDVSVVGFDDIEVAAHCSPPLTTVHQPTEEVGRMAAELLLDMLEGEVIRKNPVRVILNSELVVRGSAASPS